MNFFLAGMYADSDYLAQLESDDTQTITQGAQIPFHTGSAAGHYRQQNFQKGPLRDLSEPRR